MKRTATYGGNQCRFGSRAYRDAPSVAGLLDRNEKGRLQSLAAGLS